MKNKVSEAVSYAIKALHISPNDFFKMMEEVKTNPKEDNYGHWLAEKVVDFALESGLSYSEIFTKKARILNDLANEGNVTFNDNFINLIRELYGFEHQMISLTESVQLDKNLKFNNEGGIDLNEENLVFLNSIDPELAEVVKNNKPAFILFEVGNGLLKKDNILLKNAKQFNIKLVDEFDSLLYRLITIVSAVDCSNLKFGFLGACDSFAKLGKIEIYDLFMQYLKCEGAYLMNPLDVSDSLVNDSYWMLSVWGTESKYSIESAYLGLKDSECIANVLNFNGNSFDFVGKKNFTFPEKEMMKPEEIKNFSDYKALCRYNTASAMLRNTMSFHSVLRYPVSVINEHDIFKVFAVLLNTFSDNKNYNYIEETISYVKDNYSLLSVEAIDLLDFCIEGYEAAKEEGIADKETFYDILKEFNDVEILNDFNTKVYKLRNNMINSGVLDCFLS